MEIEKLPLEEQVVRTLKEKKLKIATAESCTGGLLSERITRISGSSEVFELGIVSYANRIKEEFLAVSSEHLAAYTAVSAEVAADMATAIQKQAQADVGVSITGIASPTTIYGDKPNGLVYVGFATATQVQVLQLNLDPKSSREVIREGAVSFALENVLKLLEA